MTGWFNEFLLAVQFLTRLPVRPIRFEGEALSRCTKWFPLVGLGIGLITAAIFFVHKILPDSVAILFAMLAGAIVTGAMHEDGLADAADGLFGHASRERALEIMRDSRIGAYGAVALWFALTLRFTLLQWLLLTNAPVWKLLVVAPVLARAAGVALLTTCANARPGSATSGPFTNRVKTDDLSFAMICAVAISVLFLWRWSIAPLIAVILLTSLARAFFLKRLGGVTGDCLGATIHLAELGVFLGAAVTL